MSIIRKFTYSQAEISDVLRDSIYLWIAFKTDGSNCNLKKVYGSSPDQVLYSVDIAVDQIVQMYADTSTIACAVNDSTYIGVGYSKTNPLTTTYTMTKPDTITENPVSVVIDSSSNVYFLTPGNDSGCDAIVSKFTVSSGIYSHDSNLTLTGINNAKDMTIDNNDNIWIITYADPTVLIKVSSMTKDNEWNVW